MERFGHFSRSRSLSGTERDLQVAQRTLLHNGWVGSSVQLGSYVEAA